MFYVRRDYYCPYCGKWQSFLSLLPVLGDRWRCRNCQGMFDLDATCIASNWAIVGGLWGLPLSLTAGVLFALFSVIQTGLHQKAPLTKEVLLRDYIGPLVCGGPILMFCGAFCCLILGYFAGLIYGYAVTKRM